MRLARSETWMLAAACVVLATAVATLIGGYFLRLRRLERLGTEAARAATVRSRAPGLGTVRGVLYLIGIAALVVAVLRPQHGGRERLVRQFGLDVVVAVDFSKSMLAEDVSPSRIGRVRLEIARLLRTLEGNRVGAVVFAGDAIAFPLSTDVELANTFFRNFDPATMEPPGTAIGRAVRKAEALFLQVDSRRTNDAAASGRADDRARIVVLFTDGEDHEGDPVEAARRAEREAGVRTVVVAVGEIGAAPIPVRDPVTGDVVLHRTRSGQIAMTEIAPRIEEKLRTVASSRDPARPDSGDRYYYRLGSTDSVAEAIAADIRRLRRSEIEARKVTLYDELYWIALAPAAILLAIEGALPAGFQRRRRRRT
ncbi:MAG: VWA domain-containing protein [Myxococcota bacterium]|nr:VWA domain-containing protein [Myxococcota bacterium]